MSDLLPHSDERALRERLADLASEIPPNRNLFPEIATRLWVEDGAEAPRSTEAREPSLEGEPRPRSGPAAALWQYRFPLIAAAALILIVTTVVNSPVLVGRKVFPPETGGPTAVTPRLAGSEAAAAALSRAVQRDYLAAIGDLQTELDAIRERLDPTALAVIEENLAIIDAAIAETTAALDAEPASEPLRRLVLNGYQKKLGFLRDATGILGGT